MRIKKVKTHVLYAELGEGEAFAYSQYWYRSRTAMIVEIECHDGTIGYGEASGPARVTAETINSVYAPILIGRNPLDREVLWLEMYNRLRDHGRKGAVIEALSAIDIALWDLAGKHFGVPVHLLAGRSYRDKVVAYATGLYRRNRDDYLAALVDEAQAYAEQGFKALKLKIGFGPKDDLVAARAIREAIGGEIELMVDANHAYDVPTAIRLSRGLEQFDVAWFEEPIVPEDLSGYAHLRQCASIPVATGEAEFSRYGFREIIEARAADIIQPDCCVVGGLTEALKVADMADAWNVRCIPHVWGAGVAVAAALQFLAMVAPCPPALHPAEPLLELDRTPNVFREQLVTGGVELEDGVVSIPDKPGLGIEINRGILESYALRC